MLRLLLILFSAAVLSCTRATPELSVLSSSIDAPLFNGSATRTIDFSNLSNPVDINASCDARIMEWIVSVGDGAYLPLSSILAPQSGDSCVSNILSFQIDPSKLGFSTNLANGQSETKQLKIKGRSVFGDTSPAILILRYIADTVPLAVAITSPADASQILPSGAAGFHVRGTCTEEGRAVVARAGSSQVTGTCANSGFDLAMDLSSKAAGTVNLTIEHTDLTGAVATASISLTKVAPVTVAFADTSSTVLETAGTHSINVNLSQAFPAAVTIAFNVNTSSTASGAGTDYSLTTSSPITFAAGETSKTISVNVINDQLVEGPETVTIDLATLSSPDAELGVQKSHTITIGDDDSGPALLGFTPVSGKVTSVPTSVAVQFDRTMDSTTTQNTSNWAVNCPEGGIVSVASVSLANDTATVNLTVTTEPTVGTSCTLTASLGIKDTNGNALTGSTASRTVTFARISPPTVISVTSGSANTCYKSGATIDIKVEFSETVTVSSGTPSIMLETGTSDAVVSLAAGSGTTTLSGTYTVGSTDTTSDLNYVSPSALASNGAKILSALNGVNALLTLPATDGSSSLGSNKSIVINNTPPSAPTGLDDGTWYASTTLSPAVHFTSGTAYGSCGISHHEARILNSSSVEVKPFATLADNSQLSGLSLSEGQSYHLELKAIDNAGNASTATVSDGWTVGTDVHMVATSSTVFENAGTFQVAVELGQALTSTATVNYSVTSGTASSPSDFTGGSGTLTFNPGDTSKNISVEIVDDGLIESSETIVLTLSSPSNNLHLGTATQHTINITDNDTAPVVSGFSPVAGTYASIPASVAVTFNRAMDETTTQDSQNWSLSCGSGTVSIGTIALVGTVATVNLTTSAQPASGGVCTLTALTAIKDSFGNNLGGTADLRSVAFTRVSTPTVVSVTSSKPDGYYKAGTIIPIEVNFSENVVVSVANPTITLETGTVDAVVTLTNGSGTPTLSGTYTVASGESSTDLNYQSVSALVLGAGGSIKNSTGTVDANLALPNLGGAGSIAVAKNLFIDTELPSAPSAIQDGSYSKSTTDTPVITFTEGADSLSGIDHHEAAVVLAGDGTVVKAFGTIASGGKISGLALADAQSYKVQLRAIDKAGNISSVVTSDGFTVDATGPTQPGPIGISSTPPVNPGREIPELTFSQSTDAGSGVLKYEIQIYDNNGPTLVRDWVQGVTASIGGSGLKLNYAEATNFLTPGKDYFVKLRAVDVAGNAGVERQSGIWTVEACPVGYVLVKGNSGYTTTDFCVAKYEMKYVSGVATSQASGTPWVVVARGADATTPSSAWKACRDLGSHYDLISNAEWQTIARSIEANSVNWAPSVDRINRGHTDQSPNNSLEAGLDSDPCFGTNDTCSPSVWHSQRRTHVLSDTSSVIWDFSGNVWEWVRDDYPYPTIIGSSAWVSQIIDTNYLTTVIIGGLTGNARFHFGAAGDYSWMTISNDYFGGLGRGSFSTPLGAILRGGAYNDNTYAGIYETSLAAYTTTTGGDIGFRCVYHP